MCVLPKWTSWNRESTLKESNGSSWSQYTGCPGSGTDTLLERGTAHLPGLYKTTREQAQANRGTKLPKVSGIARMSSGTVYWISRGGGTEGINPSFYKIKQIKRKGKFPIFHQLFPSHLPNACPSLKSSAPTHSGTGWPALGHRKTTYLMIHPRSLQNSALQIKLSFKERYYHHNERIDIYRCAPLQFTSSRVSVSEDTAFL